MNDDFLTRFRRSPHPELASSLYRKISQPARPKPTAFHLRLLAASVSALLLITALLVSSSRARALAQDLLRFFAPAQSNTFALPTQAAVSPVAVTSAVTMTGLETCDGGVTVSTIHCAVSSAEASLGFDVLESPSIPEGFVDFSTSVDPARKLVILMYSREGSQLLITQRLDSAADPDWVSPWAEVPIESVENVQIHGLEGEYVRGTFVVKSQTGTEAVWEPGAAVQRLRWHQGEVLVEIEMGGLIGDDEAIGKDWLISLAESLR